MVAPSDTNSRRLRLLSRTTLAGLLVGSFLGACATSDAMLERKRRQQELDGSGPGRCYTGVAEECYSGPDGTAGRGACRMGERTCDSGTWGTCEGEVVPAKDTCNQVDDDCDGVVDNGFERHGALCFYADAKGACRTQGKWKCSDDGTRSECDAPVVKPTEETCNNVDDDCDGQVDEDAVPKAQQACTTGKKGVCGPGTNTCTTGTVRCVQNVQAGPEICNGLDDDCDGEADNDCVSESEAARIRAGQ